MPSYKPINAVLRALDLLLALNQRPVSSIEYLHRATGIPKPTLVRLLETLGHRGLVHRGPRHGSYHLTALVASLSAGYHSEPKIVEAAGPVAVRLTKDIKWPVAVATFDVDAMVIQFSTIPYSPVAPYHSALNRRLSMVRNALGRAYLAYCSQSEREIILRMVARRGDADDKRIADNREAVQRIVAETRSRGYAVRDLEAQPESNSMAIPLFDGDSVAASMCITWYRSALTPGEAAQRYRGRLMLAAREIAERCLALRGVQTQIPQSLKMPTPRRRR